MTSLKVVNKLDEKKWEAFIESHPNGNVFQTPQMMKVYQNTKNYEPLFLAVLDETDEIQAILLAHIIKEMSGALSSFSSRAIIQGGPIYKDGEDGLKALTKLMKAYDDLVKKKAIYTQIRNMRDESKIKSILHSIGYSYEAHLNYLINVKRSPEEILAAIHKNRRKNIRKARNKGVIIEEVIEKEQISDFYAPLRHTYQNAGVPLADISLLYNGFLHLCPNKMARYFVAKFENETIGARAVLTYKNLIFDWYAGSTENSAPYYPNELLVWHILEYGSKNGYYTFDFGGAGKPGVKYGVRTFKERFGGELVNFGRFEKDNQPIKKKISRVGFSIWKKVR